MVHVGAVQTRNDGVDRDNKQLYTTEELHTGSSGERGITKRQHLTSGLIPVVYKHIEMGRNDCDW